MARWVRVFMGVVVVVALGAQSAAAKDYAQTARNIIPSGQYGSLPPRPGADTQALMYDGLTPLFDHVTNADLNQYFKSERFGIDTDGPGTPEIRAPPGRDDHPRQVRRSPCALRRPTTAASGPPAGSRPRIAACSSSRRATTLALPRSTPPG